MINNKNRVITKNAMDYILYDDIDMEKRLFVSWDLFEKAMISFHDKLKEFQRKGDDFDGIYALPRGGLCLGVKLSYMTSLPLITDRSKVTQKTLVVDDCTDTGKTLSGFADNITFVMFHKPTSYFEPTFFYKETDKQINFCWESIEERN